MNNSQFLNNFIDLQDQVSYDKVLNLGFSRVTYSSSDKSVFANFCLVNMFLDDREIKLVEKELIQMKRKPSFYFENKPDMRTFKEKLETLLYKKEFEDSWMFYKDMLAPNLIEFENVREVKSNKDLDIFINVFDNSYIVNDPQNPYGDVKGFIPSIKSAWEKFGSTDRMKYFIVYKDDMPVAVSALNNYNNIGYISCVGSLPEVRGQGFGKIATLYAVKRSFDKKNTIHCLATEEGTYPNEFYKRINFETRFTAINMGGQD